MKGYKVPSSLIDEIERKALHIGDFSYTNGMDKVIDAIKDLDEVELDNPWHTETPTYKGRYLVSNGYDTSISYFDGKEFIKDFLGFPDVGDIVKWQKIEED